MSILPAVEPAASRYRVPALVLLAAATVFGALQLAFLCDDAFITFRYVSNAHDGAGLVWNKAPFLPVEGYSCFLWALVLWVTWAVTGVEPPDAAHTLSIGFGLLEFAMCAWAALRLRRRDGTRARDCVGLLVLTVVVGNRTFLQWLTGGLETALYDFAIVGWTVLAFRAANRRTTAWLAAWSAFAAITALTRPDGLLPVTATAMVALVLLARRELTRRTAALGLAPLVTVAMHLLWRRSFYGEWLPNTYYAKVSTPWPAAGVRYLFCFVLEHGTWVALPIAIAWLVAVLRRGTMALRRDAGANVPAVAAVVTTLAGVAYYTVLVGGDHFEYRVFGHLVPLTALALAAMALQLRQNATLAIGSLLALGVTQGFGWFHLAATDAAPPPAYSAVAPHAPAWLQPLARLYDRHQAWLQVQFVCIRCRQHAASLAGIAGALPPRARTAIDPVDLPVLDVVSAGVSAWRLPDVNILDAHGLNDWVTARWPVRPTQMPLLAAAARTAAATADRDGDGIVSRHELEVVFGVPGSTDPEANRHVELVLALAARADSQSLTIAEMAAFADFVARVRVMAHERAVPLDYRAALDPNVAIEGPAGDRHAVVRKRPTPLGPDRVRSIEAEWRARVRAELAR